MSDWNTEPPDPPLLDRLASSAKAMKGTLHGANMEEAIEEISRLREELFEAQQNFEHIKSGDRSEDLLITLLCKES